MSINVGVAIAISGDDDILPTIGVIALQIPLDLACMMVAGVVVMLVDGYQQGRPTDHRATSELDVARWLDITPDEVTDLDVDNWLRQQNHTESVEPASICRDYR